MVQMLVLALLVVSSLPSLLACGHHGHVSRGTEEFASLHLRHKDLLQKIAQGHGILLGSSPAQPDQLLSTRRSMQDATAMDATLLAQILVLQQQANSAISASETQTGTTQATQAIPTPVPVRLHVEYQGSTPGPGYNTLVNVTQTVVRVLRNYLSVRAPSTGPLLVSPMCIQNTSDGLSCQTFYPAPNSPNDTLSTCGLARINPAHVLDPVTCTHGRCTSMAGTTSGVEADMYLYVTSIQDDQCASGAAAWARPCLFDPVTNRPVLGNANVCPFSLTSTDPDTLVSIMVHEVMHALGFTPGLFQMYVNPTTNRQLPLNTVLSTSYVDGSQVTRVITPTVQREARAQFGCETLDGAQLEDGGGAGSAMAHWEFTHYQGELMLGTAMFSSSGEPARFSRITLALMEDSGWYIGNWTAVGGPLQWARNTGCTLPTQGCQKFMETEPIASQRDMFCDATAVAAAGSTLRYQPSSSYRSVGQCRMSGVFSNNCSMVVARGGMPSCTSDLYQYANPEAYGWYHSATSRAYPITYKLAVSLDNGNYLYFPSTGNNGDRDAVCYPSSCQGGRLYLTIRGQQVRCPSGDYVSLPAYMPGVFRMGKIGPCPDESQVCRTLDCGGGQCNAQGGMCYDGTCICKLGWTGADCSFSILRNATAAANPIPGVTPGSGPAVPPPPAMVNVTNWYQQVTVTCQLENMTLASITARGPAFLNVLATWAGIPVLQMQVANAILASNASKSNATQLQQQQKGVAHSYGVTAADELPNLSSVEIADEKAGSTGRRLMAARQSVLASFEQGQLLSRSEAGVGGLQARAQRVVRQLKRLLSELVNSGLSSTVQDSTQNIVVSVAIRPSSTLQTTLLMNQLADGPQQQLLTSQLGTAGFAMVNGSLAATLAILREVITVPATGPTADNSTNKSIENAGNSDDHGKMLSWNIIIVAVSVGAGAVVLVASILTVAFVRSRASVRAKEQEEEKIAVEQIQQQQQQAATAAAAALNGSKETGLWVQGQAVGQPQSPGAWRWQQGGPGAIGEGVSGMEVCNPVYSSPMRRGT